jgi:cobalt-zinc-cadmium efflux system membrane fusion protein
MSFTWRDACAVALILTAVTGGACGGRSDEAASTASAAEMAARPSAADAVVVDAKMLESLKVDAIAERETTDHMVIAGKVQFDEDRLARVLVPLAGQVVDLRVKVGDAVRKGQPLCAISSREAAAAVGEHIVSHKDLEFAEKSAAMTEDLFQHEAASKIALQQAQSELAKAQSHVARTEQALHALGLNDDHLFTSFDGRVPIPAPITGIVIERKVTDGQFVQTDSTPIMTVAELSTVWVIGDVFERDLRFVHAGQSATITTAAYPGETFQGRVNYISDAIDPTTRTAKVRVSVPNPGGRLKPEMFASVALGVTDHQRALLIPSRAVFTEDARTYVYAEAGPGRFVRRPVDIVQGEGAERRVLSGLSAGDRIVVDGAILLRQQEDKKGG